MRRGLVISISTILLLSALLLFAEYWAAKSQRWDRAIESVVVIGSAAHAFDDVAGDLEALHGLNISSVRGDGLEVNTSGIAPDFSRNVSADLEAYESFFANFTKASNANASIDLSGIKDGSWETYWSNGLQARWSYPSGQLALMTTNSTNVTSWMINTYTNASHYNSSFVHCQNNTGSDILVVISAMDLNGTINCTKMIAANESWQFYINFTDGTQLLVDAGLVNGTAGGLKLAAPQYPSVTRYNATGAFALAPGQEVARWYNATMSWLMPGVSRSGRIELGRQ